MNKANLSPFFTFGLAGLTGFVLCMATTRVMVEVANSKARQECRVNHQRKYIYMHTVVGDTWHCVPAHFFNQE